MKAELLTTQQVADRCNVTARTVARWVSTGKLIPAVRLPGRTGAMLFDPCDLEGRSRGEAA